MAPPLNTFLHSGVGYLQEDFSSKWELKYEVKIGYDHISKHHCSEIDIAFGYRA